MARLINSDNLLIDIGHFINFLKHSFLYLNFDDLTKLLNYFLITFFLKISEPFLHPIDNSENTK